MLCKAGLYKSGPSLATTIKKHFLIRKHSDQYKGRHHLSTRQQPQEERQGEGLDRLEGRWGRRRRWSRRQQGWSRSPSQSHLGRFCSWFFLSSPPWSPSQVPRSPEGSGCTWGPRWENRSGKEKRRVDVDKWRIPPPFNTAKIAANVWPNSPHARLTLALAQKFDRSLSHL